MRQLLLLGLLLCYHKGHTQDIGKTIETAINRLQADSQFVNSSIAFTVVETATGKTVYTKNAQLGLAPASCQKVITSATAFALLGGNYRYKTTIGYDGTITSGILKGKLVITGSGDPSLGSWRYAGTKEDVMLTKWTKAIKDAGIQQIENGILADESIFTSATTPDGWIWQDIGNYYGAGATGLNWRENQFDLLLQSGAIRGKAVTIKGTVPAEPGFTLVNELTAGPKGSGDNAYIYLPPYSKQGFVRGTIPVAENNFTISGALPNAPQLLADVLRKKLAANAVTVAGTVCSQYGQDNRLAASPVTSIAIATHNSPPFDSLNYWFMKRSINLYGEAFVKTMAVQTGSAGTTNDGIEAIQEFWQPKGISPSAMNIIDGSGLSPQNRITANVLITVLHYAGKQPWFNSFYVSLPEINGLKMKDGYINGVRSYAGYCRSKAGVGYTFAFIVNNFYGSPASAREKIWKILDLLK